MKYSELVELYEKLESTTKRLEKTYHIAEFLKKTPAADLPQTILLLQGRLYPAWDSREMGVAGKLVAKAINSATGAGKDEVVKEWKKKGDLGKVAAELISRKRQSTLSSQELTVKKVFDNLRKLAEMSGHGSIDRKIQLISELMTSAKPKEALYITRTVLQELRVGTGAGTMRDAIVWSYFPKATEHFLRCPKCLKRMPGTEKCLECCTVLEKPEEKKSAEARHAYLEMVEAVQEALDFTNDFGAVALAAKEKGLEGLRNIELRIGVPLKVMLALKVDSLKEAFETVGRPAQLEYKYDGFRIQVHRSGKKIWIFTRRLEDVTKQFPDVVEAVEKHIKADNYIIDSEAVGYSPKTKQYMPFQRISQRIKRKYDIDKLSRELPVELNVFDVICVGKKSVVKKPFSERRKIVEKIVHPAERKIVVAKSLVTGNEDDAKKFFEESIKKGNEGLMIKKLDAPYKPGARVGHMLKYKQISEYLDLVIVGAEWGEGKRASWLSSFTIACKHGDEFLEIGKVGTGIKEKSEQGISFRQLTEMIKPLITSESGRSVKIKPDIVVEIGYGEIQKSPTYSSGFALRFPRVIRLRQDKGADEATTLDLVKRYYEKQRK